MDLQWSEAGDPCNGSVDKKERPGTKNRFQALFLIAGQDSPHNMQRNGVRLSFGIESSA
jgi:hypothetical protein